MLWTIPKEVTREEKKIFLIVSTFWSSLWRLSSRFSSDSREFDYEKKSWKKVSLSMRGKAGVIVREMSTVASDFWRESSWTIHTSIAIMKKALTILSRLPLNFSLTRCTSLLASSSFFFTSSSLHAPKKSSHELLFQK